MMSFADCWSRGNKMDAINILHAAGLWAIWNTKNDFVFNRAKWTNIQVLWRKTASYAARWEPLAADPIKKQIQDMVRELEILIKAPLPLMWPDPG